VPFAIFINAFALCLLMQVRWLGHASLQIITGQHVIYIDPYAGLPDWYVLASIVLVSRFDFDHCSVEKIRKIQNDTTRIFGTAVVAREVYPCSVLHVGENIFVEDVEIVGLPVMRRNKLQDALSFALIAEKKLVYYLSDSDLTENLENMKPDLLFVSLDGRNVRAVAAFVSHIAPKLTIPIHWGGNIGTRDDAELLKELVSTPVQILDVGGQVTI